MFNAEESRRITNSVIEKDKKEGLRKVHLEINKAAELGKFSCDVSSLSDLIKEILESEGYTVHHYQSGINEYSYKISW